MISCCLLLPDVPSGLCSSTLRHAAIVYSLRELDSTIARLAVEVDSVLCAVKDARERTHMAGSREYELLRFTSLKKCFEELLNERAVSSEDLGM